MTHIRQRRSTTAEWAAVNPILRLGEIGWDTDQRMAKLGNGVTAWNALSWLPSGPTGPVGPQGPVGETPSLRGLSVTSTTIGTGSKTFTIAPAMNVAFPVGATVKAQGAAAGNYMVGVVTAATTVSVTINVTEAAGVGTFASWTLVIGAYRGLDGMMTGPASAVSGNLPAFNGTSGSTLLDSGVASSNLMLLTGNQIAAGNKNFTGLTAFGGTPAATHSITLPSTSTGAAFYNTSDQTTNYERLRASWASNLFTLATEAGGTGTVRDLRLVSGAGASGPEVRLSYTGTNRIQASPGVMSTAGAAGIQVGGQHAASSGTQYGISVDPTINQTGTAGYTAIRANVTETAVGSGAKNLLDLAVGGVSRFLVRNTGQVTINPASSADTLFTAQVVGEPNNRLVILGTGQINFGSGTGGTDTNLYRSATSTLKTDGSFRVAGALVSEPAFTSSSVIENAFTIQPTVNQTGTAGYRGLLISVTETAVGSGTKRLIDASVGGSTRFIVHASGFIQTGTASAGSTALGAYVAGDAQPGFMFTTAGGMFWGPGGSTAVDTNLYRSGVSTLKTDHTFNAVTQLQENGQRVFSPNNRPLTIGTPASATAAGVAGQQMADATYLYTCTATNTWRRVAHASW